MAKLKVTLTFHVPVEAADYEVDNVADLPNAYIKCLNETPELIDFLIEKEFEVAAELE